MAVGCLPAGDLLGYVLRSSAMRLGRGVRLYLGKRRDRPVAIGHGTGLFSALREPLRLDLIEARRFPGGTAIHVYRPGEGNR